MRTRPRSKTGSNWLANAVRATPYGETFSQRLARDPYLAVGVFAPTTPEQLDLELANARDDFAEAWDRRRAARAELDRAQAALNAATRAAHAAGAPVTQLSALLSVTRPTTYKILREETK